jgi:hypothetical protein
MGDYRRGMDWWMEYIDHSDLQVITALLLISTIHKSTQHPLNPFPAYCVFQSFISHSLPMVSKSGDSSASCSRVLSSQPSLQNSPSTNNSYAGGHFTPISYSSLHRQTFNWQRSLTLFFTDSRTQLTWSPKCFPYNSSPWPMQATTFILVC